MIDGLVRCASCGRFTTASAAATHREPGRCECGGQLALHAQPPLTAEDYEAVRLVTARLEAWTANAPRDASPTVRALFADAARALRRTIGTLR